MSLLPRSAFASLAVPRLKERLVIVGSGWGGFSVLKRINKSKYDVTLISPSSYFNMTPLLAGTSVGTLEFRTAIESVRKFSPQSTVVEAWADKIDFSNNTIHCTPRTHPYGTSWTLPDDPYASTAYTSETDPTVPQASSIPSPRAPPFTIKFDKLVIAVGAHNQTFGIPGVKEYVHFLKDIRDARAIRMRILECFTQASQPNCPEDERRKLLNFVVVGGGPTGVEFAAELHDLCTTDMRKHYPELIKFVRITIYETGDKILSAFDKSLAEYASHRFAKKGIHVKKNHRVEEVKPFSLKVDKEGWVPFGMCVWSTGLAVNPLVSTLAGQLQLLVTDGHLHVLDAKTGEALSNVWAIGDAVGTVMREGRSNPVAAPLPATAQVASQMGNYLVKTLNIGAEQTEEFKFASRGNLAYVGDGNAIYDRSMVESGPQTKVRGRLAWLLWRSTYVSMASPRNMLNIPWYWFTNWVFGRDLSRF
ncbi:hypothetical protein BS47DRAFT_1371907 [Hydnum rufescens UP504]|uniref:FAD/NAD(P)-binding domain-containing protein n=1 Tax=Hydnum rufescens UP504 TaxID=1448309 RepID=A0A9P6B2R5_9AGAM|nr:hypothetical protein BS47DRAFT_1371907 [Hydnum rufescens UP504]